MKTIEIAEQHICHDSVFPLIYDGQHVSSLRDAAIWFQETRSELLDLAHVHGAILFRNFAIHTDQDFDALVQAFHLPNFPYHQSLSNAVRRNRTERVFTANEAPAEVNISLHHEMAQTPIYPSRLFFFCEQPATTGGATPLCRSDMLVERLVQEHPRFIEDCETKGLKYSHVMPAEDNPQSGMGRSWRSTFRATERDDCEARMAELGYSARWLPNGSVVGTTPVLDGIRQLADGRRTFFNQLIAASQSWDGEAESSRPITFGDDSELDLKAVTAACRIAEELTFDLFWQQGDVALVDNYVTMHGRRTFTGTRKILASLIAEENER